MNPLDAHDIVTTLGTLGVIAALFIETGLLIGLFLPGDSLLFVAGLAASGTAREIFGDQLSYTTLMIWAPIAATDRKSTRLNSSHEWISRMPSSA